MKLKLPYLIAIIICASFLSGFYLGTAQNNDFDSVKAVEKVEWYLYNFDELPMQNFLKGGNLSINELQWRYKSYELPARHLLGVVVSDICRS